MLLSLTPPPLKVPPRPKRLRLPRRPMLSTIQILGWVDEFYARHERYPTRDDGPIPEAVDESWSGVNAALVTGRRGLPGGSSLARLLAAERGYRNLHALPPLRLDEVLSWVDAHRARTGRWPKSKDGPIPEAPGETWTTIESALIFGKRSLPGSSSLAGLLCDHRGVRNKKRLPPYNVAAILAWAKTYQARTGRWPDRHSGPVEEAPGETWMALEMALAKGRRGLPGGSSLAKLFAAKLKRRYVRRLPPLSIKQIRMWAESHRLRTGSLPNRNSGPVFEDSAERWSTIDDYLRRGKRGLPGGTTLSRVLVAASL